MTAVEQLSFRLTQRWRNRRDSYRPAGEPIDTRRFGVEEIDEADARAFVEAHHYSASYPAARFRAGLFEAGRGLVGVAVFSVPMNAATIPAYFTGLAQAEGAELGRFVLLDYVPANGETWFLSRAFTELRRAKPGVRALVSYSDPVPRATADGTVVKPGHIGVIYQASNALYRGRGRSETLHIAPDGTVVSRRALSKLRNGERGAEATYERLLRLGAPRRTPYENPASYVARALREGPFRRFRHPGNHVYTFALDRALRRLLAASVLARPYPKALSLLGEQGKGS